MKKRLAFMVCLLIVLNSVLTLLFCSCGADSHPASETQQSTSVSQATENSTENTDPEKEVFDPSAVLSIVERKVPYYSLSADSETDGKDGSADESDFTVTATKIATRRIYTINDEDIPYVSVSDFVSSYLNLNTFDSSLADYEMSMDGQIVRVINPANSSYMEINPETQTVVYHSFDSFFQTQEVTNHQFVGCIYGSGILNDKLTTYDFYEGAETISVNLADYSVRCYVHRENVYLPYETLCVLFGHGEMTSSDAYAGNSFYYYSNTGDAKAAAINEYIRSAGTDWITSDYLLSCYNNLALGFDLLFGLDAHESRVEEGETIYYLVPDAYTVLEPYKERLLSTELDVSNDALCDLMKNEFDDGGHSNCSNTNFLSTKIIEKLTVAGSERANTLNTVDGIEAARKAQGTSASAAFPDSLYANGYYAEYGETAYIQFNGFVMTKDTLEEYQALEITDENYAKDTITLFHYVNEQIQSNPDIKNVVIDLSANGGGTVYVSEFVASWVCGGNNGTYRNTKTGAVISYRIEADVDFDGDFDEQDYLSPDINVYVMISNGSFSCANKLPCNIQDNRPDNTYFIGSRTGGGSCIVDYLPFSYLGSIIRISANTQIGRAGSTQDNFISDESGVEADFLKIDNTDYASFADIETIIDKIEDR